LLLSNFFVIELLLGLHTSDFLGQRKHIRKRSVIFLKSSESLSCFFLNMFGFFCFFFLGSSFSLNSSFIFNFLLVMLVVLVSGLLFNLGPEGG
jgi:hypothetical protein